MSHAPLFCLKELVICLLVVCKMENASRSAVPRLLRVEGAADGTMSILLVGPAEICTILSDSLFRFHNIYNSSPDCRDHLHFVVHKCLDVSDVLRHMDRIRPSVDVVVILMDTASRYCIQHALTNIRLLDPTLLFNRTALVNCRADGKTRHVVSPNDILNLHLKYGLPILKGDVYDRKSCSRMAQKIIVFAGSAVGVFSGVPFVDSVPALNSERQERDVGRGPSFSDV